MLIRDLVNFLFPPHCLICGGRLTPPNRHLCTACYTFLPRTYFHKTEENVFNKYFWTKIPIVHTASMFVFNSETKILIFNLKYKKNKDIGYWLGYSFSQEIQQDNPQFFSDIDLIVPIPLHWRRKISRGFNQCETICRGISDATGVPFTPHAVKRIKNNKSQTVFSRDKRSENVKGIFRIDPSILPTLTDKHILLVDDVITTGATICECARELAKISGVKISVLSLAYARHDTLTVPVERIQGIKSACDDSTPNT